MRMTTEVLQQLVGKQVRICVEAHDLFYQGAMDGISFERHGVHHELKVKFAWLACCRLGKPWTKAHTVTHCDTTQVLTYLVRITSTFEEQTPRGLKLRIKPHDHDLIFVPMGDQRELDPTLLPRAVA